MPTGAIEALSDEYRDGSLREMLEELADVGLPFDPERHAADAAERMARRRLVRMAEQAGTTPEAIAQHFAR